jgi:hypothetical protein
MSQPYISITAVKRSEAWYQLSKAEQEALQAKVLAHREQVGGVKNITVCKAVNAEWDFLIVDEYTDIDMIQKLDDLDAELNWRRYWDGISLLGARLS